MGTKGLSHTQQRCLEGFAGLPSPQGSPLKVGLSTAYPGLQELPGLPVHSGTLRQQVQHRGQVLLQLVALQKQPHKEQHINHAELSLSGS